MRASDGNSLVHERATATVTIPRRRPTSPSDKRRDGAGLERAELVRRRDEHHLDALTRPRRAFGVTSPTVVERILTLIMSTKLRRRTRRSRAGTSATYRKRSSRHRKLRRREHVGCGKRSGRRVSSTAPEARRLPGRSAVRRARSADMEDRSRVDRRQRNCAAEENCKQVERDHPEHNPGT